MLPPGARTIDRAISQFGQSLFGGFEMGWGNQEVEIVKTPQGTIAVYGFREYWPFVGNGSQMFSGEMIGDPREFASEPEVAPDVLFIGGAQRPLDFRWKAASTGAQVVSHERENTVLFSDSEKFVPVHSALRCAGNLRDRLRCRAQPSTRTQEVELLRSGLRLAVGSVGGR